MMRPLEFNKNGQGQTYLPNNIRLLLLIILFVMALAIRVYHIADPPLGYAPNTQYRSALISRALFYESNDSIPEWKKEIAAIEKQSLGLFEPQIVEYLAFLTYKVLGEERLWIPRLYSSLFWLIGALFLFLIIRKLISADAGLISVAYFLFIPFGIFASRSFQPDPLMIMAMLASLFSILKYFERPGKVTLAAATLVSAFAIYVKFITIFPIIGVFAFAGLFSQGFKNFFTAKQNYIFLIGSILPSAIYYPYVVFVSKSLGTQGIFLFGLLTKLYFWKGWFNLLGTVVSVPALLAGLLGICLARDKTVRSIIAGLWAGYILYSLVYTYPTYTHAYYLLFFIPIIAISLAPTAQLIFDGFKQTVRSKALGTIVICIIIFIPVLFGVRAAKWKENNPEFIHKSRIAQEIGELVNHSKNIIYLSNYYGSWLRYHGELRGMNWPTHWDYQRGKLEDRPIPSPVELFNTIYEKAENDFFVITFLSEFELQPELKKLLTQKFPVFVEKKDYIIFDLQKEK